MGLNGMMFYDGKEEKDLFMWGLKQIRVRKRWENTRRCVCDGMRIGRFQFEPIGFGHEIGLYFIYYGITYLHGSA